MDPLYNMNKTDGDEFPCKRKKVYDTVNIESTPSMLGITQYSAPEFPLHTHHTPQLPPHILYNHLASFPTLQPPKCHLLICYYFPLATNCSLYSLHFIMCISSNKIYAVKIKYMQYKLQLKVAICEQKSYHVLH